MRPEERIHSCLDDVSAMNARSLRDDVPPFCFRHWGFLYWPRSHGRRSTWVRLRSAPDCKPVTTTPCRTAAIPDQFQLDHLRLYVNGPVTENIKFMFNTDYDSVTNKIGILDAVARIELSPEFNIWAGRFLPPSDRANLYGPFYSNEWNVYTDGVQDGYPFVFQGRDNGVAYWGDFAKKVK